MHRLKRTGDVYSCFMSCLMCDMLREFLALYPP